MEILEGPAVIRRESRNYAGVRTITPFRGMFAVRDRLMKPLMAYRGLLFFRLNVVDMAGDMDISVGIVTDEPVPGTQPGVLPAGDYATMTYVGHGRRANGTLIDWIRDQGLEMDVEDDHFGCRYEAYLTDPRVERMKTRWQIELAIKLNGLA